MRVGELIGLISSAGMSSWYHDEGLAGLGAGVQAPVAQQVSAACLSCMTVVCSASAIV